MSEEDKRGTAGRAIVKGEGMRVAVSDPSLAGKVKINVAGKDEPIFWYIKFNIVLDPESVNKRSTNVTETGGYILDTEITYDTDKNVIVINPLDPYEEGVYYILNITRKVRSKGGNKLKRDIHILFKIKDRRIEEYRMLEPNVQVAKPRRKPARLKAETAARVYGFTPEQKEKLEKMRKKKGAASLPFDNMRINLTLVVIGIAVAVVGLVSDLFVVVYSGAGILFSGIVHAAFQMRNKVRRASVFYNAGVMLFNLGFYNAADKRLKKAHALDENNELAEMAARKSQFYVSKK